VWAWKEYRVKQIKKYITAMYSILPFETEFYARHKYSVEYVGNPTVNEIADARGGFDDAEMFKWHNGLDGRPIIALVPGSRVKEITSNLPIMIAAAKKYDDYQMVIAGAPGIDAKLYEKVQKEAGMKRKITVLYGKSFELVNHACAALVTSGTATLETAVLGTPQVVCYRDNGSKWLLRLYPWVLKVKYVSLPNLIANKMIIPELLFSDCSVENVCHHLEQVLPDGGGRAEMLAGYDEMAARLGDKRCTDNAAEKLIAELKK
jgi:lipid-A-disaccharide synthase